jgi:hypothetical protein
MSENYCIDAAVPSSPQDPKTISPDNEASSSFVQDPSQGKKRTHLLVRPRAARGRTATGKLRSSRNALRYGLFAESIILPGESAREFNSLVKDLSESIRPDTELERLLVEKLATIIWRQRRFLRAERAEITKAQRFLEVKLPELSPTEGEDRAIREESIVTHDAIQTSREAAFVPSIDAVVRLTGYERHLGREFDRILNQLERIRALRMGGSPPATSVPDVPSKGRRVDVEL